MQMPETVNVLLIGGGAREHALAAAITRSPKLGTLYATDVSNPGIAKLAHPVDVPVNTKELYRLVQFCDRNEVELVVIGPEDPLAEGWADTLSKKANGSRRLVFGPGAKGAMLEADKSYAKQMMRAASVPTAEGRIFKKFDQAQEFLKTRDEVYVIKATGLAKGKGVIVPKTNDEGIAAAREMLVNKAFGDAGKSILVEEKLNGTEVSVLALLDGHNILVLPPCQDHKRLLNNDEGPNTGGMGAFCPADTISEPVMHQIESEVLVPIADALRRDEIEFRGVLYAGIMLTPGGPKVLEFNVRFGDPECQPLMTRLQSDAIELLWATAAGTLDQIDVQYSPQSCVTVVLASKGYPESPETGGPITGIEDAEAIEGVTVYHAGTKLDEDGTVVTSGGRVLSVTALGDSMEQARQRAYEAADKIHFEGMQLRTDIAKDAPVPTA
ncbi:MAG: phosphoribosylamine--glycine ligase [Phycisphaerales bacterium JB047]